MDHPEIHGPTSCPRHICDCDKNFVAKVLDYHKKCLNGEETYCLRDEYKHTNNFVPTTDCIQIGAHLKPGF